MGVIKKVMIIGCIQAFGGTYHIMKSELQSHPLAGCILAYITSKMGKISSSLDFKSCAR